MFCNRIHGRRKHLEFSKWYKRGARAQAKCLSHSIIYKCIFFFLVLLCSVFFSFFPWAASFFWVSVSSPCHRSTEDSAPRRRKKSAFFLEKSSSAWQWTEANSPQEIVQFILPFSFFSPPFLKYEAIFSSTKFSQFNLLLLLTLSIEMRISPPRNIHFLNLKWLLTKWWKVVWFLFTSLFTKFAFNPSSSFDHFLAKVG